MANKKDLFAERDLAVSLYERYGSLLSEEMRQRFEAYYCQDLSLSELASSEGVSRSAIYDSLSKALSRLFLFEKKLGCLKKEKRIQTLLERYEKDEMNKEEFLKEITDAL